MGSRIFGLSSAYLRLISVCENNKQKTNNCNRRRKSRQFKIKKCKIKNFREDIINKNFLPLLVTEYYDEGKILIPWYWQSQIMHLGTMNHTKRLVDTTFVLTDTDTQDGFGLTYSFKVFRKLASNTTEKVISNDFNLVRSTTKKTNISKFGFIQLKISNIPEVTTSTDTEVAYRNNKLRLVGLGLKYVLLEGLIR